MCLLVAAWRCHRRFPLVLAANRDELYARPAAAAHPWRDPPGIIGGRDLEAGGTWLAAAPGRVAAVTNVHNGDAPGASPSRGALPVGFVAGRAAPSDYAGKLETEGRAYRGFNLLLGTPEQLLLVSNRLADTWRLEPGVHAVSNARPGEDWPKTRRAREALRLALAQDGDEAALVAAAFALLAERAPAPADAVAHPDPRLASIFVCNGDYGTRCSTVLTLDADGGVALWERRFGPGGRPEGESRLTLAG